MTKVDHAAAPSLRDHDGALTQGRVGVTTGQKTQTRRDKLQTGPGRSTRQSTDTNDDQSVLVFSFFGKKKSSGAHSLARNQKLHTTGV